MRRQQKRDDQIALLLDHEKTEACAEGRGRSVFFGGEVIALIHIDWARDRQAEKLQEVPGEAWVPVGFVYLTPQGIKLLELPWSPSL